MSSGLRDSFIENSSRNTKGATSNSEFRDSLGRARGSRHQLKLSTDSVKWVKQIRALPSNTYLSSIKPEYVEQNLKNSSLLIRELKELDESCKKNVQRIAKINESYLNVHLIEKELEWLDRVEV